MAILSCFHCTTELEVPLPDEGGPPFGTPIRCPECGLSSVIDPPVEERDLATGAQGELPQEQVPYEQEVVPMTYAERMMAEQLDAVDLREYEMKLLEEEQGGNRPGFLMRLINGIGEMQRSLIGMTSAILVILLFAGMCVMSFVGGWLFGDELFFFFSKVFELVTGR